MAKKVLMIDDDPEFVDAITNILDAKGYDVVSAGDGKDGVAKAKQEKPDIILLDLVMPDMPGEDVAAALKKHAATVNIPILFITALATNDDIGDSKENKIGNNYILPKPVRTKKLIETILNILRKPLP